MPDLDDQELEAMSAVEASNPLAYRRSLWIAARDFYAEKWKRPLGERLFGDLERKAGNYDDGQEREDEALVAAFLAGFAVSCEGFNGEYPFDGDAEEIANSVTLATALSDFLAAREDTERPDAIPQTAREMMDRIQPGGKP